MADTPLRPGATIGILGGGQLGRMIAMAARRLGFGVLVYEPEAGCPASAVADGHVCAPWSEVAAVEAFARRCDVVTFEFENVPVETAEAVAGIAPLRPGAEALRKSQDRLVEKDFLRSLRIGTAPYAGIADENDLLRALEQFGGKGILKTRRMGYDGKGQARIDAAVPAEALRLLKAPCILEGFVDFDFEISIVAARGADGSFAAFDPARNLHRGGMLRTSTVPAGVDADMASQAQAIARRILDDLGYAGVIGVEFFVCGRQLLVNEIAPRVHNSGHWTEAACLVSQFEQHVRAVCGLPLGNPARHSDCAMENLIGSEIDRTPQLLADGDAMVHLYGKREVREGRKMGHFTRIFPRKPG